MPFPTALPACPIDGGRTSGASSSTADVDNSDDADASRMSTSSSTPFASSFGKPADRSDSWGRIRGQRSQSLQRGVLFSRKNLLKI